MGSMYTAALLAKAGYVCVVLEQHYVAGGCTHSFHDGAFEFDTGLHYVGRMEKYKTLFDMVSTGSTVEWAKMGTEADGYCYDEIKLGSEEPWKFRAGEENFICDLVREFPEEEAGIREYVRLCKRANKKADMYFYGKVRALLRAAPPSPKNVLAAAAPKRPHSFVLASRAVSLARTLRRSLARPPPPPFL
jgi:all-trans-retinol 13,14-reductase